MDKGIFPPPPLPSCYNCVSTSPIAIPFVFLSFCRFSKMKDIDDTDEVKKEFLDLRLSCGVKKTRTALNPYEGYDGKIYELLRMREQMLKLDTMKKRAGAVEDGKGLHLIHLLLISATAVDENNVQQAADNLCELYQTVSLTGDSVQRVAAYFADCLAARLLTRKSPFFDMIIKTPTPEEEFIAFTELYKASPYYQFAHFTANQAILEAFEDEEDRNNRTLHVIDFDISYGFQWPSLIQSLSDKASNGKAQRISLRVTGFGRNLEELVETETRLANFAKGFCNLKFEFHGILRGSNCQPINLGKKKNETVAVNLVFYLHTLANSMQISNTLKSVYSLNPSIVVLVEQEGTRSARSFLSRFMESLHYFAAMFDSLDDCLSPESAERLCIEKNHLGKEVHRMMNYDKEDENHYQRYETLETWKGRMENSGYIKHKLSSKSMIQAKLLLKIRSHCSPHACGSGGGFRVLEREEGCALSLGWQDRHLITASAWKS